MCVYTDGESRSSLASGVYPFSLKLPEKVPCSFEGLYGRIRYSVRASLVVDKDAALLSAIVPFTLASMDDLNKDSLAPVRLFHGY